MEIIEIPSKKPICVSKFRFSCDSKDKSIPSPLPNTYNHMMVITAKPKQGKTTCRLRFTFYSSERSSLAPRCTCLGDIDYMQSWHHNGTH